MVPLGDGGGGSTADAFERGGTPRSPGCRSALACAAGRFAQDERGNPTDGLATPRGPRALRRSPRLSLPPPPEPLLTPAQLKEQRAQQAQVLLAQLERCYEAVKRPADAATPAGALSRDEALERMRRLPRVTPSTSVAQLVAMGLLPAVPEGWQRMHDTARYLLGRQIIVAAPVDPRFHPKEQFLAYKADGPVALTYRATLVGVEGDDMLVMVDGADQPMRVSRDEIAQYNQPQLIPDAPSRLNGIEVDWDDPMLKAKIHEGFARLWSIFETLRFEAAYQALPGGCTEIQSTGALFESQQEAVRILHSMVHMQYGGSSERHAGRLAIDGHGVCYDQTAVMAAILAPFAQVLGFDLQVIDGQIYRDGWRPGMPGGGGAHGWLMLTFRPGMQMRVVDRTWQQTNLELDYAYSFWGDRYPLAVSPIGAHAAGLAPLTQADIDIRPELRLPDRTRLFGEQGVHGRNNHQTTAIRRG